MGATRARRSTKRNLKRQMARQRRKWGKYAIAGQKRRGRRRISLWDLW